MTKRSLEGPKQVRPMLRSPTVKGRCKHCWAEVLWFKRADGRTHPPVVPIGLVLITVEPDVVGEAEALVRHHCDPDDVDYVNRTLAEQRSADEERIARAREDREARKITSTLAEQAHKAALTADCPVCTAPVGDRCLNLNKIMKRGKNWDSLPTHTKWPHPDRVLLAQQKGNG